MTSNLRTSHWRLSFSFAVGSGWALLADGASYLLQPVTKGSFRVGNWVQWNTTIERALGTIERGAKITVYASQSPGRAFPLRVTELDAPLRMVWVGGMPLGLFTGTRTYELSAPAPTAADFRMREEYAGALSGMIGKSIPDLQPSFDEFALCLKREAERR